MERTTRSHISQQPVKYVQSAGSAAGLVIGWRAAGQPGAHSGFMMISGPAFIRLKTQLSWIRVVVGGHLHPACLLHQVLHVKGQRLAFQWLMTFLI